LNQPLQAPFLPFVKFSVETHIKLLPVEVQGVGQKEFCIEPGIFNPMMLQGADRPLEEF
jgi:hypothetical protein